MINDKDYSEMLRQNTDIIENMLSEIENILNSETRLLHGRHLESYGFYSCASLNNLIFYNRKEEFENRFNRIFERLDT